MRRGRPLRRRTPLKQGDGDGLKRSALKPMSDKRRVAEVAAVAAEREHGAAFRAAIRGERCVVCGRTEKQAYEQTGYGIQAHHGIRKEILKRVGLERLLWSPANAIACCEDPCHRRHTTRHARIPRSRVPARVREFVAEHGLEVAFEREYPDA